MKRTKKFIGIGVALLSLSLLVACGTQSSKNTSTSNDEKTVATSNSSKETITFDTPVVTDDAIESIRTYADYIDLYKNIFDDYFTKAEEGFKGTAMENNDSFTKLKESTQKLFDAQKKRLINEDRIETTKNNVIAKYCQTVIFFLILTSFFVKNCVK